MRDHVETWLSVRTALATEDRRRTHEIDCPFALYEGHGNARVIYNIDGEPVALVSGAFALTLDTHHDGLVMMRGDWDGIEDLDLETDWVLALRLLRSFFALGRDTELTEWW